MKTVREVRRCEKRRLGMRFVCPQRWDDLAPTEVDDERFCSECEMRVYFCATDAETLAHARAGHCIAREAPDSSQLPRTVVGRPDPPLPEPTAEQRRAAEWGRREGGIAEALASAGPTCRDCPECAYPVPRWRVSCYVCGHRLGRG